MGANDLIEASDIDVAAQLPGNQRKDVVYESCALLQDELAASVAEQDMPSEQTMAMALVKGVGSPAETAGRCGPSHPLIDPSDNHSVIRAEGCFQSWSRGIEILANLWLASCGRRMPRR